MTILLDTSVLIDHLRGDDRARDAMRDAAGRLANRYLRSHPGIDVADHIIAATALAREAQLWTRNVQHFPMFEELVAPY
jgi:predicted nucleic acid-binding protein